MTYEPWLLAALIAIFFAATLLRSTFGFGDALVAMPLMSLILPLNDARPLMSLVSFMTSVTVICQDWRSVRVRSALPLLIPALVGIPLGFLVLSHVDERIAKTAEGVFIVGFAVFSLSQPDRFQLRTERGAWLIGLSAGAIGAAFNTPGPLLVMYAMLRRWPAEQFRATLNGMAMCTSSAVLIGHAVTGLVTRPVVVAWLAVLPATVIAVLLGRKLNRIVRDRGFAKFVYLLLIVLGATLVASSWKGP